MSYDPTVWHDNAYPSLNETNLNKIEQGIQAAHNIAETDGDESRKGRLQLASGVEVTAGTDLTKAVSPGRLKVLLDTRLQGFMQTNEGITSLERSTHANRPVPGENGRLFVAEDVGYIALDNGVAWAIVASIRWSDLTGVPTTFTPSAHIHDDRYYTEIEVDTALSGKSNTTHIHDARYYTESEIDTQMAGKSSTTHNHDTVYAALSHVGSGGTAHAGATTTVPGFMSSGDKTKLDGIAAGADVTPINSVLVGEIKLYGGGTAPARYLICQGQAVSRTTYSDLYTVLGDTYGAGDGTTTFNLPDLRSRVPMGTGAVAGLSNRARGEKVGAEAHTLTTAQMPTHDHGGVTSSDGSHSHTTYGTAASNTTTGGTANRVVGLAGTAGADTGTTSTAPNHSHTVGSSGLGESHNNMQPSLGINFIIRALP